MSLKAKCKLFKADLHNMTPEVMAQAGKNVEAIVEGCGMVLGDPARAQREGKTCVTAHNYRAGGCMQAPGGRCADIRPSERSVAIEIDAIVDWHEGCRGLDVCGRIAACADAKKDLECAYDMAHLSMSSTARGGTAANMSTNLMHSCNSLLTAGWYGEEPSQEVLFAAYDHMWLPIARKGTARRLSTIRQQATLRVPTARTCGRADGGALAPRARQADAALRP